MKSPKLTKTWKSVKIKKMQKVTKVTKSENAKVRKVTKSKIRKSEKSVKNHQKSWKPVLRPKMQKTGVHAVWQKCPHQMARKTRKVTFTPLSDIPPLFWPFFMLWCFFHFYILSLFVFFILSLFSLLWFYQF